jgi:hypothetical protein
VADKLIILPAQTGELPFTSGTGFGRTVTEVVAELVQEFVPVTLTEYTPAIAVVALFRVGLATVAEKVAGPLQA